MAPTIRHTLRTTVVAGQLGACAYALFDLAVVGIRSDLGAVPMLRGAVVSLGLALPLGAVIGLAVAPVYARADAPKISTVVAITLAVSAWIALWARSMQWASRAFHDHALTALVLAGMGAIIAVACVTGYVAARRLFARLDYLLPGDGWWGLAIGLGGAAAIAAFVDRVPAQLCASALALHVAAWRSAMRPPLWMPAVASVAMFAVALGPAGNDRRAREAHWRHGTFVPTVERWVTPLLDFDGDGYLAVLGGDDCEELDAIRSPLGVEIAGNGVDEDCRFGDLRPPQPRAHSPAGGAFARVVLITVSGLDMDSDGALSPELPQLQFLLTRGARFPQSVGVGGSERHVLALLLTGRLPLGLHPRDSGFPTGGPSVPWLVERAGGYAAAAVANTLPLEDLATQFLRSRSDGSQADPAAMVDRAIRMLKPHRAFLWVHFDLAAPASAQAVDRAARQLLHRLDRDARPYRVLVVGLAPSDRSPSFQRRPRGGLVAMLGSGVQPALESAPVSMFDVYPTLIDLAGLSEPEDLPANTRPIVGRSIRDLSDRRPALGGWLTSPPVMGSFAGDTVALHQPNARTFTVRNPQRASRVPEDYRDVPAWTQSHLAVLRGEFLAPQLAARNRALADATTGRWPELLEGRRVRFANALAIHGCSFRRLPGQQLEVTLYMEGGEGLRTSDLLTFKLYSPGVGSMRGRVVPVDGTLPFGTAWRGKRVAHRMLVDLRPVKRGLATLWVGILRKTKLLAVTEGVGNTRTWGRVCTIDIDK